MPHVLIFGHSFVRRLHDHVNPESSCGRLSADLKMSDCTVTWMGKGGLTVRNLLRGQSSLEDLMRGVTPSVLFVQLGENDFSLGTSANDLAFQLLALASLLKGRYHAGLVIIGTLMPRFAASKPGRWAFDTVSAHRYRQWAAEVNEILVKESGDLPYVIIWHHNDKFPTRCEAKAAQANRLFLEDGVHLTVQGMFHLYKSIRGALIGATRQDAR